MTRWMLFLTAILFVATQAAAQQQPQPGMMPPPGAMPQIVAFDNDGLLGDYIHIFGDIADQGKWGNSISSMVILSGSGSFLMMRNLRARKWASLDQGCI